MMKLAVRRNVSSPVGNIQTGTSGLYLLTWYVIAV